MKPLSDNIVMQVNIAKLLIGLLCIYFPILSMGHNISSDSLEMPPPIKDFTIAKSNHLWVLTSDNKILYSSNSGDNWEKLYHDESVTLERMFFSSLNDGWLVTGDGEIWKTLTSGRTWNHISRLPIKGKSYLTYQLNFANPSNGWIIGLWSVFYTTNGGKTWQKGLSNKTLPDSEWSPAKCYFINSSNGWVVDSKGRIYQTTNGGANWSLTYQFKTEPVLRDVFFVDNTTGWIAGTPEGGLFRTNDGGKHWDLQLALVNDTNLFISSIFFANRLNGWIVGKEFADSEAKGVQPEKGVLLKTDNGGSHWKMVRIAGNESYFSKVFFASEKQGWVSSACCIYNTKDSGLSWRKVLDLNTSKY